MKRFGWIDVGFGSASSGLVFIALSGLTGKMWMMLAGFGIAIAGVIGSLWMERP